MLRPLWLVSTDVFKEKTVWVKIDCYTIGLLYAKLKSWGKPSFLSPRNQIHMRNYNNLMNLSL